jgi:signal transduction histidine kinase
VTDLPQIGKRTQEDPRALNVLVNILLVDDEPRNLDVLESILQAADYRLVRAQTAESALLLLLDTEFAAIVLDIHMPEMSGIELANLIKQRKRTQHIPIIFLTAYFQDEKDVLQGYGSGAVDYLTKPVNQAILKSKVAVFVELFRKTRALATTNAALEAEIVQRQAAEEALQRANNELEARVLARTADLNRANDELREREAALKASEAQATAGSRAKDDFLAALSHELRTPLNPVLLLATESAADPGLPEEVRETFRTIVTNVALEARLIDDMLDLTRITHGKLMLEMRTVDIDQVLRHAISLAGAEIEAKQIQLRLRLDAHRPRVEGDEVRLKQVFWNVIENAAKFTPAGGSITVTTSEAAGTDELEVAVADTGIGMTRDELARIFEAFSQGDHASQASERRFGGMGLGLAIARVMVKRHQGSISASSEGRDQGTTFVVKLPLTRAGADAEPAAGAPGTGKPAGSEAAGRSCRILLVEDHKSTSHALASLLTRRAHRVVTAACLAEARVAAQAGQFDILISDIGLPDGNGYELMTELASRHGLVGIALSGYGMPMDVSRSQEAGFVSHLVKPVSVEKLDQALALACRRAASA